MPRFPLLAALFTVALAAPPVAAQAQPQTKLPAKFAKLASVEIDVKPDRGKPGDPVTITLKIDLKPGTGAHAFPFFPSDPEQAKTRFALAKGADLTLLGPTTDPPGLELKPNAEGKLEQVYERSPVVWEFKAVVSPTAQPGKRPLELGTVFIQVCDEFNCLPIGAKDLVPPLFEVLGGGSANANPGSPAGPTPGPAPTVPPASTGEAGRKSAKPIEAYTAELTAIQKDLEQAAISGDDGAATGKPDPGLGGFILTAAAWGLISLVTPCVFPMIPITVSIFLKHAHGSFRERIKLAAVYCLTIIAVLGVSAFALLKFMAWLSAHPATNLALAALFLVMALSLFGMYELTLPNFMSRRLQAKQSQGGIVGTIFGALAFTIISFTCVAPFLGGFAGIAAAGSERTSLIAMPTAREIAGGLAFATAFAAPFFILALVPSLMRAMPKSGGWLDSVKVVMGFLELAAAMKFLRTAELRLLPEPQYFTYELVLGGWVAISFACGAYLLNLYRLPHDEEKPNIGVMRLLFALLFLGLGFYLLPATFRGADGKLQRPAGAVYAWVEAFLLPEPEAWGTDLKNAIDKSRKSGKPVFIDFTGVTCTNCKYNELTVFPRADVREQFEKFERVQLYTDEVPAAAFSTDPGLEAREQEAIANRDFQVAAFKDSALPLYAVVQPTPDGKLKVVGVYDEGKINNPDRFAAWLKQMQEKAKAKP